MKHECVDKKNGMGIVERVVRCVSVNGKLESRNKTIEIEAVKLALTVQQTRCLHCCISPTMEGADAANHSVIVYSYPK
jgi:hypothetical protein